MSKPHWMLARYSYVGPLFLMALCTAVLTAPVAAAPTNLARTSQLTDNVATESAASKVQSVVLEATVGNAPLLIVTYGQALNGVPVTATAHVRAGIVQTEALCQILVQLADSKRVSLDAPLSNWFPALPRAARVTLRMLANSRSGYGDYLRDKTFLQAFEADPFQAFTAEQLISVGMKQPMPFEPGRGFSYAHTNLVLLGAVLQRITGKSVAQLMQERIFGPLHLTQSVIPSSADVPEPVQHVFVRERGPYEDSTYWDTSWASFSGTIISTVPDVAVMQRALGSGALVSESGFAEVLATTNANAPGQSLDLYYGLGVIVGNTWILQHAQVAGSDVVMGYLPQRDLTIVVSSALGFNGDPGKSGGYSLKFFSEAAALLAPERPIPKQFFNTGS